MAVDELRKLFGGPDITDPCPGDPGLPGGREPDGAGVLADALWGHTENAGDLFGVGVARWERRERIVPVAFANAIDHSLGRGANRRGPIRRLGDNGAEAKCNGGGRLVRGVRSADDATRVVEEVPTH